MNAGNRNAPAEERPLGMSMRRDVGVFPLRFSGRNYWGLKDPVSLRYYQLRDEEYYILRQLDGQVSLAEIKRRFEKQFAPRRIDIRQIQSFLGMLHGQGLITSQATGQAGPLLERRQKQRRRAIMQAFSNVLAIRFRGVDPERFIAWLYPKVGWFFSKWAVAVVLLLALAALTLVGVQFETLRSKLPEFGAFFTAENALWMMVVLAFTKVLHELGHALACKRFGGECHELGAMLLVFTPCLYCNVTDSWMLPSKWQRAAIGAAGMYVELALASVCTFLWWFSEPGLFNSLCLNLMFVASVSAVLFNGNPLLRYDGYYILSDLIEAPNLQQQSTAVVKGALGRWFLGIEPASERMLPDRRRGLLAAYAIASTVYRFVVIFGILWFVHAVLKPYRLEVFAQLLAVFIAAGMVAAPVFRAVKFLSHPARSREVKWLRLILVGGTAAALGAAVMLAPLPHRVSAPVLLEPRDARRVYVTVPGRLVQAAVVRQQVAAGDTLAELENLDIEREIVELTGQRDRQQKHIDNLHKLHLIDDKAGARIPAAEEALADIKQRLAERSRDRDRLKITAPADGFVLPPPNRADKTPPDELPEWSGTPLQSENLGAYLDTGATFCLIGQPDEFEALLVIDQADIDLVRQGQRVRMHLDQTPGGTIDGTIEEIARIDLKVAPPELVASGALPISTGKGAPRLMSASYQARVVLDQHTQPLLMRTSGDAKIIVEPRSLLWRLTRYLSRTFRFEL